MKKKVTFSKMILFLLIVFLLWASLFFSTSAETDSELVKLRLVVHVYEIDQYQKIAELKIYIFIDNFPYNQSKVSVWVIGAGEAIVWCNNTGTTGDTWYFQGESKQTTWLLEGMGEHFPFDSYDLRFVIYNVDYVNQNFALSSEGHQAFFTGSKAYSLKDLWLEDNGLIPIRYIGAKEISYVVQRNPNIRNIAILQFLIPIILCYYVLGVTLMLDPKTQLAERLRIHLSLFVFVPTFLIAIQKFLPYRSTFSFPELLLVNLTVSNAVFGIFSIIGNRKGSPKQKTAQSKWDLAASTLSLVFFMTTYLYTLFGKINVPASLVFTYIAIPSYIIFYFAMMTKEQFMKQIRVITFFILLSLIPLIYLLFLALRI